MSEKLNGLYEKVQDWTKKYNEAIPEHDQRKLEALEDSLRKAEADYNRQSKLETYAEFTDAEYPIVEAVRHHTYEVVKHKQEREKGVLVRLSIKMEDKRIDLLDFCDHAVLPTDWRHELLRFQARLIMRVAEDIGMTKDDVAKVPGLFCAWEYEYSKIEAEAKERDAKPTSGKQLTQHLQTVLDALMFVPAENDKTMNAYRASQKDAYFLMHALTKISNKAVKTLDAVSPARFREIFIDALNRALTDGKYTVAYKAIKTKDMKPAVADDKPTKKMGEDENKSEGDKPSDTNATNEAKGATDQPKGTTKKAKGTTKKAKEPVDETRKHIGDDGELKNE